MWSLAGDKEKSTQELSCSQGEHGSLSVTSVQLWQPEEFPVSKSWHLGSYVHCGVSVSWEAEGSLRSLQFWRAVSSRGIPGAHTKFKTGL